MASIEGVPTKKQSVDTFFTKSTATFLQKKGYKLLETIGEGSYCKVKKAVKVLLDGQGRKLACKIISKRKASEEFVTKFLPRELSIIQHIRHPNIIQVYDIYESRDHVYIFMNYCDKGDLLEYVKRRGVLRDHKAKFFFRQLVSAVHYLHEQEIAHRDLKCENIFITGIDIIVIGDFGFARSCREFGTQKRILSDTFCGSAAYAAPEILQGDSYNPKMYDVWSLGCVLYIMLTGSMPFDDTNIREMLNKQLKRQFETRMYPLHNNAEKLIFVMVFIKIVVILLLLKSSHDSSLSLDQGVIVHLFEWRWSDIADECEQFLGPYGFKGIQISPPNENLVYPNRPWWERYQPVSYQLTTRSGTEAQLRDMLKRCNKVGVRVFADVVINHMTGTLTPCEGTGDTPCNSNTLSYPGVPYNISHFNMPQCSIDDYSNATNVRYCELVGLHDLNQSSEYVREKTANYMNHLIDIGVAGFRVDAAKHMLPADLQVIFSRLHNLNTELGFAPNTQPLIYLEVIDESGNEGVHFQEYTSLGLVTDFRLGNELGPCFQGRNDLKWLTNFGTDWNLQPGNQSIVFIENHDTERSGKQQIITYKTPQNYKMAIAFMLSWGFSTPQILSSYAFNSSDQGPPHDNNNNTLSPQPIVNFICSNGWTCQHRWRQIYNMVKFHNVVQGTQVGNWWDNGKNQIAFSRGSKGFIAFNLENFSLYQTLQTNLPEGTYCDIISGNLENGKCSGKSVCVGCDGSAVITINKFNSSSEIDGVLAIHVEARETV